MATPNSGSPLGDAQHMVDMIDVFTNLLTAFPDGPAMYSIEVLLAIVKLLAYTSETALPGIAAMGTGSYIAKELNSGRRERPPEWYAAAAADYEPDPAVDNGFLTGPFATSVVGRVFRTEDGPCPNDLVVPEKGVHSANGHPLFPIRDALVFRKSDHVWHSGFFARAEVSSHIKEHLEIGARRDSAFVESTANSQRKRRGGCGGETLRRQGRHRLRNLRGGRRWSATRRSISTTLSAPERRTT